MNWFNRTNKDKDKKSENKSTSNNEAQKEIEKKSELKNIKEEFHPFHSIYVNNTL